MQRTRRAELARETVDIVRRGHYAAGAGRVDIAGAVRACLDATRHYSPEELGALRDRALAGAPGNYRSAVEVVNETTLAGAARLLAEGPGPVAALNFASAKNPGGGFLNGSQAQEESLARSSALHASLGRCPAFYAGHRAAPSLLYSDAMIESPGCPVFRDDAGDLLERPFAVTFLTSPAPNAGAAADNRPDEVPLIPGALRRRSELVLALAASLGVARLVLGAWGCGVFRNDPAEVAAAFAGHLKGRWAGRFERVLFSVYDASPGRGTLKAFEAALG